MAINIALFPYLSFAEVCHLTHLFLCYISFIMVVLSEMSRVLNDSLTYIPEKLRDKESYKFFCDLIDFVINNQYLSEIDKTEFQFDIESDHFDMSFLMRLLGESDFSVFDKNFLNNRSYAYLMSTIEDMKGSIQGLSFALALLGVKVKVYQWWEINNLIDQGDSSWGNEYYPEFAVVLDLRLEDISEPLTGEYEKKLKEFAKKLMWACIQLFELRIFVAFNDVIGTPQDIFNDLVDSFYLDEISKARFYTEHVLEILDYFYDSATVSASVLVIGEFYIGSKDAIISGVIDGHVVRDVYEYDVLDSRSEALLTPDSSFDFVLDSDVFLDDAILPWDLCVWNLEHESFVSLVASPVGDATLSLDLGFDDMLSRCVDSFTEVGFDYAYISIVSSDVCIDVISSEFDLGFVDEISSFRGVQVGHFVIGQGEAIIGEHKSGASISEFFSFIVDSAAPDKPVDLMGSAGFNFIDLSWG